MKHRHKIPQAVAVLYFAALMIVVGALMISFIIYRRVTAELDTIAEVFQHQVQTNNQILKLNTPTNYKSSAPNSYPAVLL